MAADVAGPQLAAAAIGVVALLLNYLAHSTVVAGVAWLVSRTFARRSDVREILWKAALIVPLVTAPMQWALAYPAGHPVVGNPGNASLSGVSDPEWRPAPSGEGALRSVRLVTIDLPLGATAAGGILGLWLAGATIALARQRRATALLRARIRADAIMSDAGLPALARGLGERMGVRRPLTVVSLAGEGSPFVMGRGTIVIPAKAWTLLDSDEREAILAHEVAHVVRGDVMWRQLLRIVGSIFWFQPLTRVIRLQITECAELLSDRSAIHVTGKRRALATSLLTLAEHLGAAASTPPRTAVAASGASVVRRVEEILRGTAPRTPAICRRGALGAVLASGTIALLCSPSVGMPRRTGAEQPIDPAVWNTYLVHTHIDSADSIRTQFGSMGVHEWRQFDPTAHDLSPVHIILDSHSRSERRRLEMIPGQAGSQVVRFEINGSAVPYDGAARRWLAQRLTDLRS